MVSMCMTIRRASECGNWGAEKGNYLLKIIRNQRLFPYQHRYAPLTTSLPNLLENIHMPPNDSTSPLLPASVAQVAPAAISPTYRPIDPSISALYPTSMQEIGESPTYLARNEMHLCCALASQLPIVI